MVKKGSAPTVKSFRGRFKVSYSGFVIPETGELFVVKLEKFNYETTISSIRSFFGISSCPRREEICPCHGQCTMAQKTMRLIGEEHAMEYSDIFASVTFVKLSPYSPDLNPIEQVWGITRRENTHNVFSRPWSSLKMPLTGHSMHGLCPMHN